MNSKNSERLIVAITVKTPPNHILCLLNYIFLMSAFCMYSYRLFWVVFLFPLQQARFKREMRGRIRTTLAYIRMPIADES